MADNVAITAGSGTNIASDDIGGVQYQRVKLSLGADGTAVDAGAGAGAVGTDTQRVTLGSNDPAVVALQIIDDWDESDRAKVNLIVGQAGVAAGAGAVGATTQRATLASDDPAVVALQAIDDWDESDRAKVNPIVGQAGVSAGAGAVDGGTQRTTLASDDPAVVALQIIDDWDNAASDGASVSGDVAHDAADAGEPVKIGGKAATAWPAAVANADRCDAMFDKFGRQVVTSVPRDLRGHQQTTITSSTTETTIVTAGRITLLVKQSMTSGGFRRMWSQVGRITITRI